MRFSDAEIRCYVKEDQKIKIKADLSSKDERAKTDANQLANDEANKTHAFWRPKIEIQTADYNSDYDDYYDTYSNRYPSDDGNDYSPRSNEMYEAAFGHKREHAWQYD